MQWFVAESKPSLDRLAPLTLGSSSSIFFVHFTPPESVFSLGMKFLPDIIVFCPPHDIKRFLLVSWFWAFPTCFQLPFCLLTSLPLPPQGGFPLNIEDPQTRPLCDTYQPKTLLFPFLPPFTPLVEITSSDSSEGVSLVILPHPSTRLLCVSRPLAFFSLSLHLQRPLFFWWGCRIHPDRALTQTTFFFGRGQILSTIVPFLALLTGRFCLQSLGAFCPGVTFSSAYLLSSFGWWACDCFRSQTFHLSKAGAAAPLSFFFGYRAMPHQVCQSFPRPATS